MIVFFAAMVMSSGHIVPRTSVSRKFSRTACQSTARSTTTAATSSSEYSAPRVRRRRVVRFMAIEGSLGGEVLVVDLVVGPVVPEVGELLVHGVPEVGVVLLDREAVLLTGVVLLDDLEVPVLGVRQVHREVLKQRVDLTGLDRVEHLRVAGEAHDLGVTGSVLLGVGLAGGALLDADPLAGE